MKFDKFDSMASIMFTPLISSTGLTAADISIQSLGITDPNEVKKAMVFYWRFGSAMADLMLVNQRDVLAEVDRLVEERMVTVRAMDRELYPNEYAVPNG